MAKKIIHKDPFEDYSDIIQDPKNSEPSEQLPVDPYQQKIMSKKSTSLGRARSTFSISGELLMRLKLLCVRMNQELQLSGSKKKITHSRLIEDGIRHILRKNRGKYKDLP